MAFTVNIHSTVVLGSYFNTVQGDAPFEYFSLKIIDNYNNVCRQLLDPRMWCWRLDQELVTWLSNCWRRPKRWCHKISQVNLQYVKLMPTRLWNISSCNLLYHKNWVPYIKYFGIMSFWRLVLSGDCIADIMVLFFSQGCCLRTGYQTCSWTSEEGAVHVSLVQHVCSMTAFYYIHQNNTGHNRNLIGLFFFRHTHSFKIRDIKKDNEKLDLWGAITVEINKLCRWVVEQGPLPPPSLPLLLKKRN